MSQTGGVSQNVRAARAQVDGAHNGANGVVHDALRVEASREADRLSESCQALPGFAITAVDRSARKLPLVGFFQKRANEFGYRRFASEDAIVPLAKNVGFQRQHSFQRNQIIGPVRAQPGV